MGDSLWGTPAIRAIKKKFPNVCVDLLVQPQWIPLFKENKNIRCLIPYHPKWYRQLLVLPSLLKTRYDHLFIFHANRNITRILPWIRTSSIWSHQYPDIIPGVSENQIIHPDKPIHGILRRIAMLEKIHIYSDGTHMDIYLNDSEIEEVDLFLQKHNIRPNEFVYLNIGGSFTYKQWPINKFIELSKIILEKTSLSIVLGGGPKDKYRIDAIGRQLDQSRIVEASYRSLIENCTLISKCKILITPDSGPMHIGYALKVPTIGLFWSINSHGIKRNVFNGPDYCGPLDLDNSLNSVISGSFIETKSIDSPDALSMHIISVKEVWDRAINFM
jgi:ADP-heptose:LPS heptosyltransferase